MSADGGAAFLLKDLPLSREYKAAMAKREYFAVRAMQGLLAGDTECLMGHETIARLAVEQSDALLKALEAKA
jgi:hypothetical protein